MSHLPIGSNNGSVHRFSLACIPFCSALRIFCGVLVSCRLNPPFQWVNMSVEWSRGAHIGVHRMIFSVLLVIVPTVTVVSLHGGLVGTIGALGRLMQFH